MEVMTAVSMVLILSLMGFAVDEIMSIMLSIITQHKIPNSAILRYDCCGGSAASKKFLSVT